MSSVRTRPSSKWFVWWWHAPEEDGKPQTAPSEQKFDSLDAALDHMLRLLTIEEGTDGGKGVGLEWIRVFHLVERDCRVRWTAENGYEHATPYAREYIKERTRGAEAKQAAQQG
jgi:hypothetical protein